MNTNEIFYLGGVSVEAKKSKFCKKISVFSKKSFLRFIFKAPLSDKSKLYHSTQVALKLFLAEKNVDGGLKKFRINAIKYFGSIYWKKKRRYWTEFLNISGFAILDFFKCIELDNAVKSYPLNVIYWFGHRQIT